MEKIKNLKNKFINTCKKIKEEHLISKYIKNNKIFVFFCTSSLKSNFCIDKEIFLYFFAVENDNFKSLKFEEKQCKIYML